MGATVSNTNYARNKQGKPGQDEVEDPAREIRLIKYFDEFRKSLPLHIASEYKQRLSPRFADLPLTEWIRNITPQYYEAVLICYLRVLSKKLHDFVDITQIDVTQMSEDEKKKLFLKKSSFKSYCSCISQGLNRLQTAERQQWKDQNLNEHKEPQWFSESKMIHIYDADNFPKLRKEVDKIKKLCLVERGPTERKSSAFRGEDFQYFMAKLYETFFPRQGEAWQPSHLIRVCLILINILNPGRGGKEQRKRDIKDIVFGTDIKGQFIEPSDAMWTKMRKTAEQNDSKAFAQKPRIYCRGDGYGFSDVFFTYRAMRPTADDIDGSQSLNSAFFLKAKEIVIMKPGGRKLGFCNSPIGHSSIDKMQKNICNELGVKEITTYQFRGAMLTEIIRAGGNLFDAMKFTGHDSVAAANRYAHCAKGRNNIGDVANVFANNIVSEAISHQRAASLPPPVPSPPILHQREVTGERAASLPPPLPPLPTDLKLPTMILQAPLKHALNEKPLCHISRQQNAHDPGLHLQQRTILKRNAVVSRDRKMERKAHENMKMERGAPQNMWQQNSNNVSNISDMSVSHQNDPYQMDPGLYFREQRALLQRNAMAARERKRKREEAQNMSVMSQQSQNRNRNVSAMNVQQQNNLGVAPLQNVPQQKVSNLEERLNKLHDIVNINMKQRDQRIKELEEKLERAQRAQSLPYRGHTNNMMQSQRSQSVPYGGHHGRTHSVEQYRHNPLNSNAFNPVNLNPVNQVKAFNPMQLNQVKAFNPMQLNSNFD